MPHLKPFGTIEENEWVFPNEYERSNKKRNKNLEGVRQWLLSELFKTYNYPKDWIEGRISFYDEESTKSQCHCSGFKMRLVLA